MRVRQGSPAPIAERLADSLRHPTLALRRFEHPVVVDEFRQNIRRSMGSVRIGHSSAGSLPQYLVGPYVGQREAIASPNVIGVFKSVACEEPGPHRFEHTKSSVFVCLGACLGAGSHAVTRYDWSHLRCVAYDHDWSRVHKLQPFNCKRLVNRSSVAGA